MIGQTETAITTLTCGTRGIGTRERNPRLASVAWTADRHAFQTHSVSRAQSRPLSSRHTSTHYLNRGPLRGKPTAHISYHEGLRLIRQFLDYSSRHTVEELQAFTTQWVPAPAWVRIYDSENCASVSRPRSSAAAGADWKERA